MADISSCVSCTEIDSDVISAFVSFSEEIGAQSISIAPLYIIYGILFISEKSLTQEEISERSGYSLSVVSNTLNYLLKHTDIARVKEKGERKKRYICTHNCDITREKILNTVFPAIDGYLMRLDDCRERYMKCNNASCRTKAGWIRDLVERHRIVIYTIKKIITMDEQDIERVIDFINKLNKKSAGDRYE